jgi:hypothetical protein
MTQTEINRIAEQEAAAVFATLKQSAGFAPRALIGHIDTGGIVDMATTPTDLQGSDLDAYWDATATALREMLVDAPDLIEIAADGRPFEIYVTA